MTTFILGKRSLLELNGVCPDLVKVVKRAIQITPIDFAVVDGVRTIEEQRRYVAVGASQTMESRHLTGHAVDLVAFVGNKGRYEEQLLCSIAAAMRAAAREQGIPLRWGGCWSPNLTDSDEAPEVLIAEYRARKSALGQKPLVDSPHFELPRAIYS